MFVLAAEEYLRRLRRHGHYESDRIVDKMPGNFLYVGMIRLMMPNARVVHCVRDPAATCFSCYTHLFNAPQGFTYDLRELGVYYRSYERLMAHWHEVLPGFIHDVCYEDLIADQETVTRRLLEFCELDWDDACLAFHKTERPVRTASAAQVRQPLYSRALSGWRRYESHLGPLLTALAVEGPRGALQRATDRKQRRLDSPTTRGMGALAEQATRLDQRLAVAHELFRRGELDHAESACRALLAEESDNADLFTLHGMIAVQKGDPEASIKYFEQAVTLQPDQARFHNNLGLAFKRAERLDEAEAAYRRALSIEPHNAQAHNNLGVALRLRDDIAGAIASFRSALAADREYADARGNLARALYEAGNREEAAAEFRAIVDRAPADTNANLSLASIARQLGNFDEALVCLQRVLAGDSNDAAALYEKGLVLQEQGDLRAAKAAYERAIRTAPTHARAHNNLGLVVQALGDLDGAIGRFRRAIAAQPDYAEAHRHLAFARHHDETDDDVRRTESLLESAGDDSSAMHASFALAKIYDDLGRVDEAFAHLTRANRLKRSTLRYDVNQDRAFFDLLKQTFGKTFFDDRQDWGVMDRTPVFIVGMPRSGTSLVEQILASHTRVWGAGEVLDLDRLLWDIHDASSNSGWCTAMAALENGEMHDVAVAYLSALQQHARDADRVTDKTPGNFHYIGMIQAMLPGAKIVNCVRDPLDTCFSCYQNYFAGGVAYGYDLSELGTYYRLYVDLMDHWRTTLPGLVYDLCYEELLDNQESETRKLLDFCGLKWEEGCLEFHLTERPVQTASVIQVRRPVYKSSVGRAARYAVHLAPLRDALGALAVI